MTLLASEPSTNRATEALIERRRAMLRWGTLLLAAVAMYAGWAIAPYLAGELRRLEPWKIALLYSGNTIAAIWFLRFFWTHLVMCAPLMDRVAAPGERVMRAFVISMLGGLAFDAGFTLFIHHQDGVRYAAAEKTVATVRSMTTDHRSLGRNWRLQCEWRDRASGGVYEASLRVHAGAGKNYSPIADTFPGETAALLERDEMPATVQLRYDPAWPRRAWLEGISDDDNGLFYVEISILLVQLVVVGVAMLLMSGSNWHSSGSAPLPWWLQTTKMIPAGVEIVVLAFVGTLFRLFGY